MAWLYLLIAGMLEVTWAIGLKYSHGFTQFRASVATVAAMILSIIFLAQALKYLPVGTGYAVWTGVGAFGTAVLGIVLFDEPRNPGRLLSLLLLVAGIVGLRLSAGR
jgi:quaternary ammonium compound-resistance protein SugE